MPRKSTPVAKTSLAELMGAFSYALDLTEGQPAGHCVRSCFIGTSIGRAIGLSPRDLHELYYTVLLKDLGCSSNAARICELYQADDRAFKQAFKTVGTSLAATLRFIVTRTAAKAPLRKRMGAIGNILRNGDSIAQEMILSRCTRGADIARSLHFSDGVCGGIYSLDEHWDGSGRPGRQSGKSIPVLSRIALLAQIADVFHTHAGRRAAEDEIARRAGSWLDPMLALAFTAVSRERDFWPTVESPLVDARVLALAPPEEAIAVDEEYLDAIAAAFGEVIDAKSPYTAGHSIRVRGLADSIGAVMGIDDSRRGGLQRAALLHDIGKLGVSNRILDKPAALDDTEWVEMRSHAAYTQDILGRIGALTGLASTAAAHHERLDGAGYPLGLAGAQISLETRIITVCDFYDALTSDRPYRAAIPSTEALAIMNAEVGKAIDGEAFGALRSVVARN